MWRESSVVADIRSNFSIFFIFFIFSRILHFVKNVSLILKQVQNDTSKISRNARPRIETSSWFWEPIILLSLDRAIIPPSDVWWTPERNSAPAPEHCNQFYSLQSIPVMLKCLCCRFRGSASWRRPQADISVDHYSIITNIYETKKAEKIVILRIFK